MKNYLAKVISNDTQKLPFSATILRRDLHHFVVWHKLLYFDLITGEVYMVSGARLGSKKFLPEMRAFATFIKDMLDHGIPGYKGTNPIQWCEKFGLGLLEQNALYQWQNGQRAPSVQMAVLAGILLERSGADIGVYDPLLAAADGYYSMWMEKLGSDADSIDPTDRAISVKPQKVDISPTPEYAIAVYEALSWNDRIAAMHGMLGAIARDTKFVNMTDDLEVIQELVRESVESRGGSLNVLADSADVPVEWIKAIIAGHWEEVRAKSDSRLLIQLADKIQDLDGKTRSCEFFAPLMDKSLIKSYLKEVKRK